MSTNVTFDTNDLQTSTILTSEIDHGSMPEKSVSLYALAHANRGNIAYTGFSSRRVRLAGKLIGTSISNLDTLIDTFKGYLNGQDKNLDIDYAGGTRRYIATLNGLSIDRPYGLVHANYVAEFVCSEPFGRNTTTTSALSATARTASSYTDNHTFLGTAPFQLPIITITINSVTDGDNFLKFSNSGNSQSILLAGVTFAAADVIVIDCEEKLVTLNGDEIDFIGAFPEFPPGDQSFAYSDGFTARNFDIDVDYYPMWT